MLVIYQKYKPELVKKTNNKWTFMLKLGNKINRNKEESE